MFKVICFDLCFYDISIEFGNCSDVVMLLFSFFFQFIKCVIVTKNKPTYTFYHDSTRVRVRVFNATFNNISVTS
jgi:hypothetical protein